MYTLIGWPAGVIVEAVVLSKTRHRMRVAAAGFLDALELRRTGMQWLAETGEAVELDFMMPDTPVAETAPAHTPTVRVRTAGSSAFRQ